jgi:oxygen-dependent protoporphyrinogen oxidase
MKDAVIIGAGLAGLSAGWRLRHWDTLILEADERVGGRIKSERRGRYWLNWGGHVFAGPGSATDVLLHEVGVEAVTILGALAGISMNGKFVPNGQIATYPFRLPMSPSARLATLTTGVKIMSNLILKYLPTVRHRPGESDLVREQRILDFESKRTFQDFIGTGIPRDAESLFEVTVIRSAGSIHEISAGEGIGYFNLVLGIGQGLNRGIVGGPSTLTEAIAVALGDRVQLGAPAYEIVEKKDSVIVRYRQDGVDKEVEARTVVLATTANVSHRIGVNLPGDLRDALSKVKYGPHVSSAFLTNETSPRRWDNNYAIATPKRSMAIVLNQASIIRSLETERQPGGSIMTFSPAHLGRALLDKSDEEVQAIHLADLEEVLGQGFSDSVVEASTARWEKASPYTFPGREKIQSTLMRGASRVFLAGDYLGSHYTDSSISTGFEAATQIGSILATDRQTRRIVDVPKTSQTPIRTNANQEKSNA